MTRRAPRTPGGGGGARRTGRAAALTAVLAVVLAVAPAAAQEPLQVPDARLVLVDLEAVVGPGSRPPDVTPDGPPELDGPAATARLVVENTGGLELDALRLVVESHPRATSRSQLRAALDGPGPETSGRVVVDRPLDTLPVGGLGQELLEVQPDLGQWGAADLDVAVHPLVVSVVRGSEVLDSVRTAVVWLGMAPAEPLRATAVLPVAAPPASLLAGVGTADDLRPGALVDRLVRTAEAAPGVFAIAPDVATVEDLRSASAGGVEGAEQLLERLRSQVALASAGPLSTVYAGSDLQALTSSELTADLAATAVAEGRRRLRLATDRPPGEAHLAVGPASPTTLDLVPTDLLVTRWDAAGGVDLEANPSADLPPPVRTTRTASGRVLQVLVGDPWVTDLLGGADGRAGWHVDAHRVLVESAMVHAESPAARGRVLVLVPPESWEAPGGLGPALAERLAAAPWLELSDPGTVAALADAGAGWAPVPAAGSSSPVAAVLAELAATRARLDGLSTATAGLTGPVEPDDPPVPDLRAAVDELLRATSIRLPGDRVAAARTRVQQVRAIVDGALGTVEVPDDAGVTLTSDTGTVPVTVRHADGVPMEVVVELESQGRLAFDPEPRRTVQLPADGTATVSFDTVALGRGQFPVEVRVSTPDGAVLLDRSVLSVRATVVSRPALLGVGAVVLGLLLLGGRRRRRRPRLEVVDTP